MVVGPVTDSEGYGHLYPPKEPPRRTGRVVLRLCFSLLLFVVIKANQNGRWKRYSLLLYQSHFRNESAT